MFEDNIDENHLHVFKSFKQFSNITHLSLNFYLYYLDIPSKRILEKIDIHLPGLQYLEIKNLFEIDQKNVSQIVNMLSQLPNLHTIRIGFRIRSFSQYGKYGFYEQTKQKIARKCSQIRNIILD